MVASEFEYWASNVEYCCGTSGEKLVKKANIPNTVVALWGGNCGALGRWWIDWNDNLNKMKSIGYHVINITKNLHYNQLFDEIENRQKLKTLYGVYFWGHGYSPYPSSGLCSANNTHLLLYTDLSKIMKYTLGFAYIFACDSNAGREYIKALGWIGFSGTLIPAWPWSDKWKVPPKK